MTLEEFADNVDGFSALSASHRCDYFVYYLTIVKGADGVSAKEVEQCFDKLKTPKYSNIPQYLKQWARKPRLTTKKAAQKFVQTGSRYHLERTYRDGLSKTIVSNVPKAQVNTSLRNLLPSIANQSECEFLQEAIMCFEVGAFRAASILVWLLTIDHMQNYILKQKLPAFNSELGKVKNKRVKVTTVTSKDDFTDIPENIFIELCRASGVITADVRKILDEKLGTRNSIAHPSSITLKPSKALDFIDDLVHNVILKY